MASWASDTPGPTAREYVIPCGACGAALTDAEIRFLWSDVDFLHHGPDGHRVHIDERNERDYFIRARELEPDAGDVVGYADEHESGQLRIGVAGEQVPLLPLPDDTIPTSAAALPEP